MDLSLAYAELTSGFAVSKQDRKGFVAVHAALLLFFHEQGCNAQQGSNNDPIVTLRPDF